MWDWWRKHRRPDPKAETDTFFRHVEADRKHAMQTHRVVHLLKAGGSVDGLSLTPQDLAELRRRLSIVEQARDVAAPRTRIDEYGGFVLYDPYEDDRYQTLEEVPSFEPVRRIEEIFWVNKGCVELPDGQVKQDVAGVEEWLIDLYRKAGRLHELANEGSYPGSED